MTVSTRRLFPDLPCLVVEPSQQVDLVDWANQRHDWISDSLGEAGALLFRGFRMRSAEDMDRMTSALDWPVMGYMGGTAPRSKLAGAVQTSTEIDKYVPIPMHSDMSYAERWPQALMLMCIRPALFGGETPVADMAAVYDDLPAGLRARFEEKRVRIIRVAPRHRRPMHPKTWPEMYGVHTRAEVEALCTHGKISWEEDDTMILTTEQDPYIIHPRSGRRVWFNQVNVFHRSLSREFLHHGRLLYGLGLGVLEQVGRLAPNRFRYPYQVAFGDGSEISSEDVRVIRETIWRHTHQFKWQRGDVLLVDNERLGHGRNPYRGPRTVGVVMFEKATRTSDELPAPANDNGGPEYREITSADGPRASR